MRAPPSPEVTRELDLWMESLADECVLSWVRKKAHPRRQGEALGSRREVDYEVKFIMQSSERTESRQTERGGKEKEINSPARHTKKDNTIDRGLIKHDL